MINFLRTSRKRYREKFLTPLTSSDHEEQEMLESLQQPKKKQRQDLQINDQINKLNEDDQDCKKKSQYICNKCSKSFSTKSNLNKHIRKYHDNQSITAQVNNSEIEIKKQQSSRKLSNAQTDIDQTAKESRLVKFLSYDPRTLENQKVSLLEKNPENIQEKGSKEFMFLQKFHYNPATMIPIYYHLKSLATQDSQVSGMGLRISGSQTTKDSYIKIFNERQFVHDQTLQIRMQNEYAITSESKLKNFKNIIGLEFITKGEDHIGFVYPKFEMNFGQFLKYYFEPNIAKSFLLQMTSGIKDLHSIGYTHRNLIPQTVLINLNNPSLVIVDFEDSQLHSNLKIEDPTHSQLFYPVGTTLTIGNPQIDIYSIACFLVYTYMCIDFFCKIDKQEQFQIYAEEFLFIPDSDKSIQGIIKNCILETNSQKWPTLQQIRDIIIDLEFIKNDKKISNQSLKISK